VAWACYQGMNLEILSPDEIKGKYPFIETHDLEGRAL
jgi:dimethylglycine dehydrogenase